MGLTRSDSQNTLIARKGMPALYQLALLGTPTAAQISELEEVIEKAIGMFNLRMGHEIGWEVCPDEFNPGQQRSSAAAHYGH